MSAKWIQEAAEERWPHWVCPPADEDPEPDYSGIDAKWQNAEADMQRAAFIAGVEAGLAKAAEVAESNLGRNWIVRETPGDIASAIRALGSHENEELAGG